MVSDKEILIQSLESYTLKTVANLFGFESIATQTLIRYAIRLMADKYSFVLDIFTDTNGKINVPLLINAAKSEMKARGGVKFWGIKFTDKDIEEINDIYQNLSKNNQ